MRGPVATLLWWSALTAAPALGAGPSPYAVGSLPVAALAGDFEAPLSREVKAQLSLVLLSQGTYTDANPFGQLSAVAPSLWLHYDGFANLRLSAAFQENRFQPIEELGVPASHEERFVARARAQQPRGTAAIYEILQLDVRSLRDAAGTHRWVFRPRLRVGSGINLDATRIHSLVLFQEGAVRFGDSEYVKRTFEFYRAVVGYTWTTRRGFFVTAAVVGQASMNPGGTRLDFVWGPALGIAFRIFPPREVPAEPPPEPPELAPP